MDFNLTHLLILLFLLFPIIRRFLEKQKQKEESGEEAYYQTDPGTSSYDNYPTEQEEGDWHSQNLSYESESKNSVTTPSSGNQASTGSQNREKKSGEVQSWEDFFDGLEKVLAGDEPDSYQRKTGQPEAATSPVQKSQTIGSHSEREKNRRFERPRHPSHSSVYDSASAMIPEEKPFPPVQKKRLDSENLLADISMEKPPEVTYSQSRRIKNYGQMLRDENTLRDAIVLKEIFDLPKSRRKHLHRF